MTQLSTLFPRRVAFGDGGIATSLQRVGLGIAELPEAWCLTQPEKVSEMHRSHAAAGAAWLTTNTFGANRPRLEGFGLADQVQEVCRAAVVCARRASPDLPVLGSIGPVLFDQRAAGFYTETAEALREAGADGLLVETIVDIRGGVAAVRSAVAAGLPVVASWTPAADGGLLDGTGLEQAAQLLASAGAAAVGVNCGEGPEAIGDPVRRLVKAEQGPVYAAPNAGLPTFVDGAPRYLLPPDSFARAAIQLVDAGACLIAGCCGVGAEHLAAAALALGLTERPEE